MSSVALPAADRALAETACPACGSTVGARLGAVEAEPPAPRGPWTHVQCGACASLFLSPRPADPAALYAADYHVHRAPGALGERVARLAAGVEAYRLSRLRPAPAEVYEIGCGRGLVLAALARRGYRVSGIELSLAAARAARALGVAVEEGAFSGGRGVAGGYDLVLAAHVLEHVPDPRRFLADLRRILRPGGVALLKLPLAGSLDLAVFGGFSGAADVPYHLLVPSREALVRMIAEEDLELVRLRADPVPNDWIHGLRRSLRATLGFGLPLLRPSNPLLFGAFLPLSLLGAAIGMPGRARVVVRKPA